MVVLGRLLAMIMAVSYSYFGYVDVIGPYSLGIISVGCLSLVLGFLQLATRQVSLHKVFILVLVIGFLLIWLDALINGYLSMRVVKQFVTPVVVFFCAYGISRFLNFTISFLYFFSGVIVVSCLVAVLQGLNIDMGWDLRYAFPVSDDKMVEYQLANKLKPAGLAFYAVQLGYQMVLGCLLILAVNSVDERDVSKRLVTFGLSSILIAAAVGSNLSALVSVLITVYFYFRSQRKFKFRIKSVVIVVLTLTMVLISPIGERILTIDASMLSRVTYTVVGAILIFNNPFGVEIAHVYEKKLEVVNQLGAGNFTMLEDILDMGFHNSFLNVGVQLGWLGILLYIFFYFYLVRHYFSLIKNKSAIQSKLGSVGFASMLGYFIQVITHNAGPFNLDIYFWIGNGLLLGLISKTRHKSLISIKEGHRIVV